MKFESLNEFIEKIRQGFIELTHQHEDKGAKN